MWEEKKIVLTTTKSDSAGSEQLQVLLLEDSDTDADLLMRFLKKENISCNYTRVWDKDSFVKCLIEKHYDLIMADHSLPQFSGIEAFRISREKPGNIPFILITGTISEKAVVEYAREGIDDYILKDNLLRLPTAIENVVRKKNIEKLNAELSAVNHELELANSNMRDSINYARLIQNAMLSDESELSNFFPYSFIYYKPKHVISGDFFWFEKMEHFFFVAAADCTGHGVPGAILAMMGFNLLNEVVNVEKVYQPASILENLNVKVRKILKPNSSFLHDGMDMALGIIDIKNERLYYTGANRPLLIERKGELIELYPNKISIGGKPVENKTFTNQVISLFPGDRLFMFSDGITDQFSGSTNKKLTLRGLKNLILDSARKPAAEQNNYMINYLDSWKGEQEQTDDMLLMCIRIPERI